MQVGTVVLIVLGVMIFSQVVLLARASVARHTELMQKLAEIERRLDAGRGS